MNLSSAEGESFHVNSWRVFSIDKATGKVQLVPVAPTAGTVYLGQAQGYNNAVKLLNDACSNLYSDENKGITARSINMEDIESVMDQAKIDIAKTSQGYGTQNTNAFSKGASNYPVIYGREKSAIIDGILKESGLGLNEQNKLIGRTEIENGKTATGGKLQADTSIQPFNTAYAMNNNDFSEALGSTHTEILLPSGTGTVDYWVAARYVVLAKSVAHFGVHMIKSGGLSGDGVFESMGYTNQYSKALFPIVSLRADLIIEDATNGFCVQ